MKKDIIDHLAVCTDDIAKSVTWYIDNFNCNILYQDKSCRINIPSILQSLKMMLKATESLLLIETDQSLYMLKIDQAITLKS